MSEQDNMAQRCADLVMENPKRDIMLAAAAFDMLLGFAEPGVKYSSTDRLSIPAVQYQHAMAHLVTFLAQTSIVTMFAEGLFLMDQIKEAAIASDSTLNHMRKH